MDTKHDFQADNRFFLENYDTLMGLYYGKAIAIANDSVLFVAETPAGVRRWANRFCMAGKCSILEVSCNTYTMLKEGIIVR